MSITHSAPWRNLGWHRRQGILLFTLLSLLLAVTAGPVLAASASEAKSRVKGAYEAFLRRPVTGAELDRLYAEEVADQGEFDADRIAEMDEILAILRREDGKPAGLHLRHDIVETVYFKSAMPFAARLVAAMDPPVVVDKLSEELMTQADVLALVQILKFWNSGTDPKAIKPGPEDARLAASLTRELETMISQGGALPEMLRDASALRVGLARHWTSLSARDKDLVRAYMEKNLAGKLTELPPELYGRLMGWSSFEIKMADLNKTIEVGRMWQMTHAHMLNLQRLYNTWHAAMAGH